MLKCIHYELYYKQPVFSKWITVNNNSGKDVVINEFKSEQLAAFEPESSVDHRDKWLRPNITVETDYNFGGMSDDLIYSSSVAWKKDPMYNTQVNYEKETRCLLIVKKIEAGGYYLLASRHIDAQNDVVLPEGRRPRFGSSPCIESEWGQKYFAKLYNLYDKTGLRIFEHDGSYPGDLCYSTVHLGHKNEKNSQWNQFTKVTDFYKWCRSKGIYLNIPDMYFLNGGNKVGMGYREANWSLPREQQEIVERQNIFDGTWLKAPSMGWMFVPLVEYQGGGKEATIEPSKDHLPAGKEKGLLMVYNPLNKPIKRKINVNLYYTGLTDTMRVSEEDGAEKTLKMNRGYQVEFDVIIIAKSQTWFVIK